MFSNASTTPTTITDTISFSSSSPSSSSSKPLSDDRLSINAINGLTNRTDLNNNYNNIVGNNNSSIYTNQQFLTITQDPYPPINCSPDFYDSTDGNSFSASMSMIDCIDMNELNSPFSKDLNQIKKENLFNDNDDKVIFMSQDSISK
jgi:hypothetical protein